MCLKWLVIRIIMHSAIKCIGYYVDGVTGYYVDGVTLVPRFVDVLEETNVALHCIGGKQYLTAVRWNHNGEQSAVERYGNSCKAYGFLMNRKLYSHSCFDNTTFSLTLNNISRVQNGDKWKCITIDLIESNIATIFVKVQARTARIFPKEYIITIAEHEILNPLLCESNDCRPEPTFLWYMDRNTKSREDDILLWEYNPGSTSKYTVESYTNKFGSTLNRTMNGWYLFCGTTNSMAEITISDKILLNITYPPDNPPQIVGIDNEGEYRVIEGKFVNLTCSVTGGYPLPILQWNRNTIVAQELNGSTVTQTISWQASREDQDVLTCTSIHLHKIEITRVNITILFPPDKPSIAVKTWSREFVPVKDEIDIIEHKPFVINCSANSYPPVSVFEWSGLSQINGSILQITKDRGQSTVVCKVSNRMKESKSDVTVIGFNSTSLNINILYPPTVNILDGNTRMITEWDTVVYTCNVSQGNPNVTEVAWSWKNQTWYGHQLTLQNVSRNQAGVYQCCASNIMISSDLSIVIGKDCVHQFVNIGFQANVLNFFFNKHNTPDNLTVDENDAVNVTCEIEGNAIPEGNLMFRENSYMRTKLVGVKTINTLKQTSTNLNLFTKFHAQCTDAGQYTCTGRNTLHNGLKTVSARSLELLVKCKPRKSPFNEIPDKVYCALSRDVTLSLTALAYPVPPDSGYVWYKKSLDDNWTAINISASENRIIISTSGLQSNLSITNITQSDYALYKIEVENDIGRFDHIFSLTTADDSEEYTKRVVATVGGAAGSVLFLLVSLAAAVLIRKSAQRSESYTLRNLHEVDDSHANQNFQAVTTHSSFQTGNPNVYEELHSAAGDDYSTLNMGNPNMYEELQQSGHASYSTINGGKQNVYEEIQNPGEHILYQNLQMTSINEDLQDE